MSDSNIQRLWASVIIQALLDATSQPTKGAALVEKRQAVAWITAPTGVTAENFEMVCAGANVNPDLVRRFFRSYEGPPLTMQTLSRLRDQLTNETDN